MIDNLFCKIFVLAAAERETITEHVAHHLGGQRDGCSVICDWGVVDVLKNDDADGTRSTGPDGFLHFPYLIETEADASFDRDRFVGEIARLLESLWAKGLGQK